MIIDYERILKVLGLFEANILPVEPENSSSIWKLFSSNFLTYLTSTWLFYSNIW